LSPIVFVISSELFGNTSLTSSVQLLPDSNSDTLSGNSLNKNKKNYVGFPSQLSNNSLQELGDT
jgi:hypothetical protein